MKRITSVVWGMERRLAISFAAANAGATTVADWTFETTQPTTAGPFSPEVGSGSALGSHAASGAVYSSPAGNGTPHSFSANGWAVGDYWQFQVATTGLGSEVLDWDQASSATGPGQFTLQYSTDGTSFTIATNLNIQVNGSPNTPWSGTGATNAVYHFTVNLSGVTALDNQANDFFRIVDSSALTPSGGTVSTAGTDRVDNFIVSATAVPEPSTVILVGTGLFGLLAICRRRS